MVWLKRFLASLLFLTVAWLGFLIFSLKGGVITIVTFTLVGLVIFSLLKANRAALILCLSVFFVFLGVIPSMNLISSEKKSSSTWEKWSLEAQESALAEGKLVLVDVTADWCITCKVNKTLVLDSPPLVNKLLGLQGKKS